MSLFPTTTVPMSLFPTTLFPTTTVPNPNNDMEVSNPPDDSISALAFSPVALPQNFLVAGSWDNNVRCWEIDAQGKSVPKSQQTMQGPVLDVCWQDDGQKVFMAGCDKTVQMWDLATNQSTQIAAHEAPVKTIRWVKSPQWSALMSFSWDKTIKFWDTRQAQPMLSIALPERAYCADVVYPMAVVGTAGRGIIIYQLEGQPREFKKVDPPLKHQLRCVSIFRDKNNTPTGFALGSVEGRVAIQYVNSVNPKDNFTFKCHRTKGTVPDIFPVNDLSVHPAHGTLATVGSDGKFSFWDKDLRTKLKESEPCDQAITKCAFNKDGQVFAYAVSYDWSKGHTFYNPHKKNSIFLRPCFNELKPRKK